MTETEVITLLSYTLASNGFFRDVEVEQPKGSWRGSKNRNVGDINIPGIEPIEAKGTFNEAKKDFLNPKKNNGIKNYVYHESDKEKLKKQKLFWSSLEVENIIVLFGEASDIKIKFLSLTDAQLKDSFKVDLH